MSQVAPRFSCTGYRCAAWPPRLPPKPLERTFALAASPVMGHRVRRRPRSSQSVRRPLTVLRRQRDLFYRKHRSEMQEVSALAPIIPAGTRISDVTNAGGGAHASIRRRWSQKTRQTSIDVEGMKHLSIVSEGFSRAACGLNRGDYVNDCLHAFANGPAAFAEFIGGGSLHLRTLHYFVRFELTRSTIAI